MEEFDPIPPPEWMVDTTWVTALEGMAERGAMPFDLHIEIGWRDCLIHPAEYALETKPSEYPEARLRILRKIWDCLVEGKEPEIIKGVRVVGRTKVRDTTPEASNNGKLSLPERPARALSFTVGGKRGG